MELIESPDVSGLVNISILLKCFLSREIASAEMPK